MPVTASLTLNGTIEEIKTFLGTPSAGTGTAPTPAPPTPTPTPTPAPTPAPPVAGNQKTVQVGPTRQFAEPADAAASLAAGGTLVLDDGVYRKAFHIENEGVTIKSASGNPFKCYFDGQGGQGGGHMMAWQKGMLHASRSITVDGVGFRNCGGAGSDDNHSNEAGIWLGDSAAATPPNTGKWQATVRRCAFDNCGNGVFTSSEPNLTVVEIECIFGYIAPNGMNAYAAGKGAHPAHDNYLECDNVDVSGSYFYGSVGHNVKLRSAAWNVHDNPVMTQDGGRVLDAADGGKGAFTGNTVFTRTDRQAQVVAGVAGRFGNANMIGYALESQSKGVADLAMTKNTLHISRLNSVIAAAAGTRIVADASNVAKFYGQGSLVLQGNVSGGLSGGSAPPGAPPAPALPPPPAWATP